ncbi:uroporphyrinogen decarboxylase [bacterium]|nr:uroporphyrinogen decarboxylase [bacterium]
MVQADKRLLKVLEGEALTPPPVWLMRQAGRHLPEYHELRAQARDFLDFCYSPSLATEATLQPIRRYGMDGAILFADILLILDALGRKVAFVEGEGPRVAPLSRASDLQGVAKSAVEARLSPVFETVRRVRAALPPETTLIGFAGSPWTVAIYGIEGRGGTDKSTARMFGYEQPEEMDAVLRILADHTVDYLAEQAKAGADVLMLFESWAEGLPEDAFERWVVAPTRSIVEQLRARGINQPVIGFPRGAGALVVRYAAETGVSAVGLDTAVPTRWANEALPPGLPVQGNLDPLRLMAGGPGLDARVREIRDAFRGRPHIFNLGHGVPQTTPIDHVVRMLQVLREAT